MNLSLITRPDLKDAATSFRDQFESDFLQYPASIKYHQNYPGGLNSHTELVMNHATSLYAVQPTTYARWFTLDELLFAALLHDAGKLLQYQELPDGTFEYRHNLSKDCPVFDGEARPFLQGIWKKTHAKCGGFEHEIASCQIANFFYLEEQIEEPAKPLPPSIENAILCHSGGWSRTGVKPGKMAYLLHCADLLGSQFEVGT